MLRSWGSPSGLFDHIRWAEMTDLPDLSWIQIWSLDLPGIVLSWSWYRSNLIFQMQISGIRKHRQCGSLAIVSHQTNLKKKSIRTRVVKLKLLVQRYCPPLLSSLRGNILFLGYMAFVFGRRYVDTLLRRTFFCIFFSATTTKSSSLLCIHSSIHIFIYLWSKYLWNVYFVPDILLSILIIYCLGYSTCERRSQNNKPLKILFSSWHSTHLGN